MRTLKLIQQDIERCQTQIAATYEKPFEQSIQSTIITREGFQIQLCKLFGERNLVIKQIKVIAAEIMHADKSRQPNNAKVCIK